MILIPGSVELGQLRFCSHDKSQDELRHGTCNRRGNSTGSIDRGGEEHIQHQRDTLRIHDGSHIAQAVPS